MKHSIVFLDTATIGPGVTVRRPRFAHDWTAFERTAPHEVAERLARATVAITNEAPRRTPPSWRSRRCRT